MAHFINKQKILVGLITASITATTIGGAVYGYPLSFLFGGNKDADAEAGSQVVEVEVKDIENTINVTGALASSTEMTAMVDKNAADLAVKEIKVKIGDEVKEGDVLFTLDTSDLEKSLKDNEQKLAVLERKNAIAANQQQRDYSDLKKNNALAETQEIRNILNAEDKLDDNYVDQGLALDELYKKYGYEDQSYYEACDAQLAMYDAEDALNAGREDPSITTEELNELITNYNSAVERFNTALTAYEGNIAASIIAEAAVRTANRTIRDAEKELIDKNENLDKANRERNHAEKKAVEGIETADLDRSTSDQEITTDLMKIRKQLAAATITSKSSGIVTAVNAVVGQVPTNDPVVVTDINHYNVACDVDEQYISDIKEGMQARFTTNATGEDFLNGVVSFVAVTPTKQQSSNNNNNNNSGSNGGATSTSGQTDKSRGTYRVLIKVNDQNDRIRPGMTAKITIITNKAENVTAVPVDAIDYDLDGNPILHVTKDEGATSVDVKVTTGLSDGTYTQVTGEGLTAGTKIIVPEEEADELPNSDLFS